MPLFHPSESDSTTLSGLDFFLYYYQNKKSFDLQMLIVKRENFVGFSIQMVMGLS